LSHFIEAFIFLACAVLIVPLFRPLGSVIGYLVAGLLVGPFGLGLVSHVHEIMEISELGVLLLLFLIGLELEPRRLWSLRIPIFALGSAQLIVTAAIVFFPMWFKVQDLLICLTIAFGVALSSTAFGMQMITERNQLLSPHGRRAFSILLFQDLALIPLLVLLPMLAAGNSSDVSLVGPIKNLVGLTVIIVLVLFLSPLLFRFVAQSRNTELFTATTLLVAIGTAWIVSHLGMPMSLGAFLAGVVLADSEFKHEIESHIAPFKALLLGLFFMAVGMSLNWRILTNDYMDIMIALFSLLSIKLSVLYTIGRLSNLTKLGSFYLAVMLSQGGEFAFVLFSQAFNLGVMNQQTVSFWGLVVTLSMLTTPFLLLFIDKIVLPKMREQNKPEFDVNVERAAPVIIAGFGRFGQDVAEILKARDISFTALESNFEKVSYIRADGNTIYFGDATKPDLLRSAKADHAKIIVVAVDEVKVSMKIVTMVKRYFPHLKVFVRARDQAHLEHLSCLAIDGAVRETYLSSLETSRMVMNELGLPFLESDKTVRQFHNNASVIGGTNHQNSNPPE